MDYKIVKILIYNNRYSLIIIAILVWAFLLRVWGVDYGLPLIYPKDESQLIPAAVRFGSGDFNPHSFTYPSLHKYLLFILYGVYFLIGKLAGTFENIQAFKFEYFNDPSNFYIIARIFSAVMGTLTIYVIYLIGSKIYKKEVGLLAALFVSLEYWNTLYSHIAKPDALMVFFLVCSIYFACKISDEGKVREYILAGIFGGLAISAKYNALFVCVPIAIAHLTRNGHVNLITNLKNNFHYLVIGLILVPMFFFVGTPYALIEYKIFFRDLEFVKLVVTRGDSGQNYFSVMMFYIKNLFLPEGFDYRSNFVGIFVLSGFFVALVRNKKSAWPLLSFVLFHFIYFTYKTASSLPKPHYLLPMLPIMFIFAAEILAKLKNKLPVSDFKRGLLLYCFVFILLIAPSQRIFNLNYKRSQKDTGNYAREWVEKNLPDRTKILMVGRQDIALRLTKQSLLDNAVDVPKDILQAKLDVLSKYPGKAYYLQSLNPGWNVTEETVMKLDELPLGAVLPEKYKFSMQHWKDMGIEYVIVISETNVPGDDFIATIEPMIQDFTRQLEVEMILIKEYMPEPPRRPGRWIRIYKMNS